MLCAALLPVLGLLFQQIYVQRQAARDAAFDRVHLQVRHTAQDLGRTLQDYEAVLKRLAQRPLLRALDSQACDPLIADFVRLYPEFTNLVVQDLEGQRDCSYLPSKISPDAMAQVPGYTQARAMDGLTVGGAVLGPLSGRWVSVLFYPVNNLQGQRAGLISLPVDLLSLGERLLGNVPPNLLVVVADAQGRIVLRSRKATTWMGQPLPEAMQAHAYTHPDSVVAVPGADGEQRLFAWARVPQAGWTVWAGVAQKDVYADANRAFGQNLAWALGLLLGTSLLAWRMAQRITRPMDALHSAAAQVAAGQVQARVALQAPPKDLGAVALEFNHMLDSRARAEQERADSEARFRTLADLSSDWYWEQDTEHRIVRLEGRFEEGTGLPMPSYLGKHRWDLPALNLTEQDWAAHRAVLQAHMPFRDFVVQRQDAQGRIRWGAVSGAPIWDAQGCFMGYRGVGRDITQVKRQEQERLGLALHIEELSRRLVQSQEDIRRRFSRELHDRTSPNLAALRINLDILGRATPTERDTPLIQERVEDMRALIEDTTLSVREICAELHPPVLDRGGLLAVVRSYAEPFARRTGVAVQVLCGHGEVRMEPDRELALFRIVQEALTNSAKHAHARSITVQLQLQTSPLSVCITDDGVGFDVQQTQRERRTGGLGLIYMRETAEFAGGRLSLQSCPGEGTRICVEIDGCSKVVHENPDLVG